LPERLSYDRLVATAKVFEEKCCDKDAEEDDDYSRSNISIDLVDNRESSL
jgi:hypothetical protein